MKLEFWGAAQTVTGSCFLIRAGGRRLLVDCGLIQGTPAEEARNREPFPFDPAGVDAVVLTHAHLDHSGRLPLLLRSGFHGPIYAHRATRDLCRIMLKDAGYINEREAEWNSRKRLRKGLAPVEPLYNMRDAAATVRHVRPLEYDTTQEILPGVRLRLQDAGHILGSSIVELWLKEGATQRKLVFSGDLGHYGAPVLRDPRAVREADLVVLESTYGSRNHRSWKETWKELSGVFEAAGKRKGNILVPAFAVGRTQELLYVFGRNYHEWGVDAWTLFLDSPLAIEATEIYARHAAVYDLEATQVQNETGNPFSLPNLKICRTARQSMALNRIRSGALIIAGSGMCDGGRIKHHLKHNVWRKNCHILITGFQAQGTPGRALVDGARYIRLWGETVRVAARVHTIGGLSAHAGQDSLFAWYQQFGGPPPVALVHGEPDASQALAGLLRRGGAARVTIPSYGDAIELAELPTSPHS